MMKKYVKSFTVFITLFALLSGVFFNTPVKNVEAANDPSTFSFWDFVVSKPEATAGDADVASHLIGNDVCHSGLAKSRRAV